MRSHFLFTNLLWVISGLLASGCGVSQASPSDFEWNPIIIASPSQPFRSFQSVSYSFEIQVTNPSPGDSVFVRPFDCTVLGADGSTYGTYRSQFSVILSPGNATSGAIGPFIDTNATRPPATQFSCSTSYNQPGGQLKWLEARSTFLPPR